MKTYPPARPGHRCSSLLFRSTRLLLFAWLLLLPQLGGAQTNAYERARELARQSHFDEADALLSDWLQNHPDDTAARLLRAHNQSWAGKYQEAIRSFRAILADDPDLTDARTGLAYTYAWSGDTPEAERLFTALLHDDPPSEELRKGLGHTYLIARRGEEAELIFTALTDAHPATVEYWTALGQAHLLQQETRQARRALDQALQLAPNDAVAQDLYRRLPVESTTLELDVWGGYSNIGGVERLGPRIIQAYYQAGPSLAVFARYDNTLSLDNIDFVTRRLGAGSLWAGALWQWRPRLATKLEYGQRFFEGESPQQLFRAEQIFFTRSTLNVRVGGFAGLSADRPTEWFTYGSVLVPLGRLFFLEPTYYFAKDENSALAQHRFLMAAKYHHPDGFELTVGGFYGRSNLDLENQPNRINGGYLLALAPLTEQLWAQLAVNHENGIFNTASVFALGLKWKLAH